MIRDADFSSYHAQQLRGAIADLAYTTVVVSFTLIVVVATLTVPAPDETRLTDLLKIE